jgi:RNA polymerase sigma factor for flagellar operon FliA
VLARHHGLHPDEADDFHSWVKEKLIENDYAIIGKYPGDATLRTYLATVIANLFLDYRNHNWGKGPPSAEARRLGPLAVRLERLLGRDGHTIDEAIEILRARADQPCDGEVRSLAAKLTLRPNSRRPVRALPGDVASSDRADDGVYADERQKALDQASVALQEALAQLPGEDQLIFRLLIWENMSVADIARALRLEQKPLYKRIDRAKRRLAHYLQREGVDAGFVRDLLAER